LRGLGDMSYTLYILHYPLMLTLFFAIRGLRPELFAYPKLLSFAGILVSLAASALFAHWLERDYSGFCRRMARGWKCWHRSEKTA
jgi:peptidoglycan/LPS O-acetylase OafA/YrhL